MDDRAANQLMWISRRANAERELRTWMQPNSDADVQLCGHVTACTPVEEGTSPSLCCDVASVAGVQFVQLQKLFLVKDKGFVPRHSGPYSAPQEGSPFSRFPFLTHICRMNQTLPSLRRSIIQVWKNSRCSNEARS